MYIQSQQSTTLILTLKIKNNLKVCSHFSLTGWMLETSTSVCWLMGVDFDGELCLVWQERTLATTLQTKPCEYSMYFQNVTSSTPATFFDFVFSRLAQAQQDLQKIIPAVKIIVWLCSFLFFLRSLFRGWEHHQGQQALLNRSSTEYENVKFFVVTSLGNEYIRLAERHSALLHQLCFTSSTLKWHYS